MRRPKNLSVFILSLITVAVLSALTVGGCASGPGQDFDLQSVPMFRNCGKTEEVHKTKETVDLGGCSWRVNEVRFVEETGKGAKAEGKYVLVDLTLTNKSESEDLVLTGIEIELFDRASLIHLTGAESNGDVLSQMALTVLFQGGIKKGETIRGWVAFDVPVTAKELKLRVRDLTLTSGATAVFDLE